jgi:Glycosyltransferase family 17
VPRLRDTFMFGSELDMLEVRLREFGDRDVQHILVEAPVTHRGDPKPLFYAAHKDRFAPWAHRITHVVAAGLDAPMDSWAREHAQRDAAMRALRDAADDDVVLISDVDEFPPWPLPALDPVVAFRMRLFMYAVDWQYPELHHCAVAARWGTVKNRGLAAVRDGRYGYPAVDGGMHLTWLGGIEEQREKLRVTCHTEMSADEYERIWSGACYERGEHHSGTCQMIPAEVDETWPRQIWQRKCPPSWFRPR